ncbi:MAG: glycosyltransferase [Nitrospirae bacterium]|nr:glycosyltransferase [Nitrospirota bacterium]
MKKSKNKKPMINSKYPEKKIAILLPSGNVGGAERLILDEMSCLKDDTRFYFEIHIVFEAGIWQDKFKSLGIPVHVWGAPHSSVRMLWYYFKLLNHLRKKRINILHIHLLNHTGPWVGRLAGSKVVTTVHSDYKFRLFERICLKKNDLLLACSAQVLKNLSTFIPGNKLKLLNNAVRIVLPGSALPGNILHKLELTGNNKVVLTLGRLSEEKGHDILIEAFRRVVEKLPECVLLIAGNGPDRERLEKQIKSSGMQKKVRLVGLIDDVSEIFKICDIYVNSSRFEGLPISLLEAMAHEKPIVATAVGGNREVIRDGETGLLVPPERPDLLAEGLLKLMEDEKLAAKLAKKAFELFNESYSIDNHCKMLALEYLNIS